jgi:hypothetical protein
MGAAIEHRAESKKNNVFGNRVANFDCDVVIKAREVLFWNCGIIFTDIANRQSAVTLITLLSGNDSVELRSAPASGAISLALASDCCAGNGRAVWCSLMRSGSARGRAELQPRRLRSHTISIDRSASDEPSSSLLASDARLP